eukprot:8638810-Karenia_brevis.AAC.1
MLRQRRDGKDHGHILLQILGQTLIKMDGNNMMQLNGTLRCQNNGLRSQMANKKAARENRMCGRDCLQLQGRRILPQSQLQ